MFYGGFLWRIDFDVGVFFLNLSKKKMKIQIGNEIKRLRKERGVSQEEIADFLDVSQSTYGRIENGKSNSWSVYVQALSGYFEVDLISLVRMKKRGVGARKTFQISQIEQFVKELRDNYSILLTEKEKRIKSLERENTFLKKSNKKIIR
jgi:transcriptional regulator with XRE-family HTH domain